MSDEETTKDVARVVEALRDHLAALEADAAAVRRTIAVLLGTSDPHPRRTRRHHNGSTPSKIIDLLASEPTREWDCLEVYDAMKAKGWTSPAKDPQNGVRTALARLAERGEIQRVANGIYQFVEAPE